MDKREYEIVDKEERDKCKKAAKKLVQEWHDKINPNFIFLTETTATPYGWVIREAWKNTYPSEKVPKFFRIDPIAKLPHEYDLDPEAGQMEEKILEGKKKYFSRRQIPQESKVLVFDECGGEIEMCKEKIEGGGTLRNTARIIQKAYPKVKLYISGGYFFLPHNYGRLGMSVTPTTKIWNRRTRWEVGEDEKLITSEYKKKQIEQGNFTLTGRIVKHPEQRKRALAYVRELKQLGREAGQELHAELEAKKSLEQKVSAIIGIGSLGISLFFLSSNLTGNAVGNLESQSSNLIGVGLLFISLVAGVFLMRRIK